MFESTKKFPLLGINTLENRIEIVEKESKMRNTEKEAASKANNKQESQFSACKWSFSFTFSYLVLITLKASENPGIQIFLEKREMKTYQIIYSSLTAVDR